LTRFFGRRPSPALVLSIIALFAALGGVSYGLAGKNTVSSDDIVNGGVKSKDIKNSGVKSKDLNTGSVKTSDVADDALTGDDINENSLNRVPRAEKADDADALGGENPSAYALVDQPDFTNATLNAPFTNFGGAFAPASFMKDTLGFVHLRGLLGNCPAGTNTAFTLPEGFRPSASLFAPMGVGGGGGGNLTIEADGDVRPFLTGAAAGSACGLDGISFKAEQ
jgi:hypothetical protein